MPFISDPQGREEVEKVSRRLKLPVWKSFCKGNFRKWWNEWWDKIDTFAEEIEAIEIKAGTGLEGGGNLTKNRTLNLKKATGTELGGIVVGDNLTIDETGRLSGNPAVDISGKMDSTHLAGRITNNCNNDQGKGVSVLYTAQNAIGKPSFVDGALFTMAYDKGWYYQMAADWRTGNLYLRGSNGNETSPIPWFTVYHSGNFNPLKCPFPVGGIYTTFSEEHPAVTWPGTTWVKIEGRFLLGSGGGYNLGWTGGSPVAALNVSNIPSHTHSATQSAHAHTQPAHVHSLSLDYMGASNSEGFAFNRGNKYGYTTNYQGAAGGENTGGAQPAITVGYTGSGAAFSIMPPYIVVNLWNRTS